MTYRLFIDDERFPPEDGRDWVVVRSVAEAVAIIEARGLPQESSWDHDLGDGPSAMALAHWLADYVLDRQLSLADFRFYVHSQNPIGRDNLNGFLTNLLRAAP